MRFRAQGSGAALLLSLFCARLCAQTPAPPPFKAQRVDEDYSYLKDPARREEPLDTLKFIPLDPDRKTYLSLGGEIRERYEFFNNGGWGRDPDDNNGYLLQRYMLHADLHLGSRLRFFGQLKSGLENGRTGGPRPPDADRVDVQQAFMEIQLAGSGKQGIALRAGRQELSFGSSRLVSFREGPNVRQAFDGALVTIRQSGWRFDIFAIRPVETNRGAFDDSPDHTRSFWGVYSVHAFPLLPKGNIDLYYFGLDRKRARFDSGSGREQRHSSGARIWGKTEAWDYNIEPVFQWGRYASGDIRAWTVASDTGYRFESLPFHPRLGLKADVASGDGNPTDNTLGTFNALFPKGAYFSEADLLGPYNIMDLHPSVELQPARPLTVTVDGDFFWRQSTHDGVYGISGNLIQSGRAASARYIGTHASTQVEWRFNRHWSATAIYLHFFPGDFLRQAPPGRNVNFVAVWTTYKF
ncbi:alginate export family protein [uncultured Paludibaculum sp.]|uniref:alginate export family protein n=1 Tax=uncultured Paludibaculum sp. TaxID=1765020 RepID=UPI002AAA956A|nr:alginate export family protein [uncultured Paludibaculum sp.]